MYSFYSTVLSHDTGRCRVDVMPVNLLLLITREAYFMQILPFFHAVRQPDFFIFIV